MTIKRFVFEPNGEKVIKVTTVAGSTGYIVASVPVEALETLLRRLDAEMKRRLARLRYYERRGKRRQFSPTRVRRRRRCRLKTLYRGPLRYWSGVPRAANVARARNHLRVPKMISRWPVLRRCAGVGHH
jgi:hypothetical protein